MNKRIDKYIVKWYKKNVHIVDNKKTNKIQKVFWNENITWREVISSYNEVSKWKILQ